MRSVDLVGYIASTLVLLTFYMKDMVALRVAAICSNVAFLVYGGGLHLAPVIFLHGLLLPLNAWRLTSLMDWQRKFVIQRRTNSPTGERIDLPAGPTSLKVSTDEHALI